ncbi:hypothetical protein C5167_007095 [Papaver somniferum]|uniref:Uncharacterized protein n=1 Tax=Papaver somniferum TaxID=3469 RepID=A0A4Y7JJ38_PAPSO|nr:hypothetical protein C5167_007095 [Papaver somniferum]
MEPERFNYVGSFEDDLEPISSDTESCKGNFEDDYEPISSDTESCKGNFEDDYEPISSDAESLNSEKTTLFVEKTQLLCDIESLKSEKTTLFVERTQLLCDIESLKSEKTVVVTDICSLNKRKIVLETDTESDKRKKSELGREVELCSKEKGKLQSDVESLKKETTKQRNGIEIMNSKKNVLEKDIESLDGEKNKLESELELMNREKAISAHFCLAELELELDKFTRRLNPKIWKLEEKDSLHQDLSEEKDEFIRGAIHEVNESIPERENALAEIWEAQQELIEQMASKKVTRNTVIGVKENTMLWNFREKKRATLKEAISFQFNRTAKHREMEKVQIPGFCSSSSAKENI